MKKLMTVLALATLVASPAFAKTRHLATPAAGEVYAYAGSTAVVADGRLIGADPDAFIREDLLRQNDPTGGNGN